jgi:hypothetical protein
MAPDWSTAAQGYSAAVALLPLVAWHGLDQATREHHLREWAGLAGEAATATVLAGDPTQAVELLEAGRAMLWTQALHLRQDLDELRQRRPDLADRLDSARAILDLQPTHTTSGRRGVTASAVSRQWHDSAGHYKLLTSADFNYFGIGLAVDSSGKKIWTALFMKGPDRTGAWAKFRTDSNASADTVSTASTGARRRVRIEWKGADRRLQVLTAGFASFQVQKRRPGVTDWTTIYQATTREGMVRRLLKGQLYEYRIRARDKKGNVGDWSRSLFIRP